MEAANATPATRAPRSTFFTRMLLEWSCVVLRSVGAVMRISTKALTYGRCMSSVLSESHPIGVTGCSTGLLSRHFVPVLSDSGGVFGNAGTAAKECDNGLLVAAVKCGLSAPRRVADRMPELWGRF